MADLQERQQQQQAQGLKAEQQQAQDMEAAQPQAQGMEAAQLSLPLQDMSQQPQLRVLPQQHPQLHQQQQTQQQQQQTQQQTQQQQQGAVSYTDSDLHGSFSETQGQGFQSQSQDASQRGGVLAQDPNSSCFGEDISSSGIGSSGSNPVNISSSSSESDLVKSSSSSKGGGRSESPRNSGDWGLEKMERGGGGRNLLSLSGSSSDGGMLGALQRR